MHKERVSAFERASLFNYRRETDPLLGFVFELYAEQGSIRSWRTSTGTVGHGGSYGSGLDERSDDALQVTQPLNQRSHYLR